MMGKCEGRERSLARHHVRDECDWRDGNRLWHANDHTRPHSHDLCLSLQDGDLRFQTESLVSLILDLSLASFRSLSLGSNSLVVGLDSEHSEEPERV